MHSQRAFSCRSKSKRIPARFASRRRSLSTSDLQNQASTTPIVQHSNHTLTLNTIVETNDNSQGSKDHESTKNDTAIETIKRATTSPGEL